MHSGTLSGSLMPPSRNPRETCAFRFVVSDSLKVAMTRGATPLASVEPGLRDQRRAGVVVGEDAVEDLLLVLAEVVVAQAAGDAELGRSPTACLRRRARTD